MDFDKAGNLITSKPKTDKLEELEKEFDNLVNGKEVFCCQYCNKVWDKQVSKSQHETWCSKNPNKREYRKAEKKIKKKEKEPQVKPKTKTPKGIDIIKELRDFDKVFGLTDEQIVRYIRDKIEG
nr:MAG: Zn finger protein [uncultured archaeon]